MSNISQLNWVKLKGNETYSVTYFSNYETVKNRSNVKVAHYVLEPY